MKDLMADGDAIFKPTRQTSKCLVELNDDSITLELGMSYAYLNVATDKVYAHSNDETRLYEQPQFIEPLLAEHVNLLKATTPNCKTHL
jgi:hypothetical protein